MGKSRGPSSGGRKAPPPASAAEDRETASVQIWKRLAKWAKVTAAHEGISMGELLSPMIEAPLTARYHRAVAEMGSESES